MVKKRDYRVCVGKVGTMNTETVVSAILTPPNEKDYGTVRASGKIFMIRLLKHLAEFVGAILHWGMCFVQ
ncbi:MAG: hypothetical protein ACOX4H_06005 [Bacillota bacterium]|jgi:hypothetical protein